MTFDLCSYRFCLRARRAISFPASGPANWLRGGLGSTLRKIACAAQCPGHDGHPTRECAFRSACAYARIFEPVSAGPSGLADPPRPFVFRASQLADRGIVPGETFWFGVNFFDTHETVPNDFARAFALLDEAELECVEQCTSISVSLRSRLGAVDRLHVEFLTPTELKGTGNGNALRATPEFPILFARARDRVSTLRAFYGSGPLDIDFRGMGERARSITMTKCELRTVVRQRRSSRTGQVHGIGGFTGVAEYEGDLAEFLPILEAARWTGIGRHCVWGNGEILPRVILNA